MIKRWSLLLLAALVQTAMLMLLIAVMAACYSEERTREESYVPDSDSESNEDSVVWVDAEDGTMISHPATPDAHSDLDDAVGEIVVTPGEWSDERDDEIITGQWPPPLTDGHSDAHSDSESSEDSDAHSSD